MNIFVKNKSNYKYLTHFLIILLCSFFINFYYARIGVFPIDTFLHYDAAYRILTNEYPVRDFWVVSGLTVDFLEAFFSFYCHVIVNIKIFKYLSGSAIVLSSASCKRS